MILKFNWLKSLWRRSSVKLYSSIDEMPIHNWMKVHETSNLAYVAKLSNYNDPPKMEPGLLLTQWKVLYSEYITEFGIHQKYRDYLEKQIHIAQLKCDLVITDDATLKTFIRAEQAELESMIKDKEKVKYMEIVAALSRFAGFRIDTKAVTVLEYYSYIRDFEKANKNASKHG